MRNSQLGIPREYPSSGPHSKSLGSIPRFFHAYLRPRPGKIGPKSAISGVGPNEQNVGGKSPDWEIRASRPLPITDTRTATAGFPAAFLGPEFDSGNRASEQSSAARSNDSDF